MTIREILKRDSDRHTVRVAGRKAIIDRERGRGFTIQVEEGPGQYSVSTYNEQGELEKDSLRHGRGRSILRRKPAQFDL